ncbi:DeoR/GlpR family DNA-binding transcription regulator [Aquibacillus sp. 3ASR75-11]|uniref:DeoR/GlpR family DNA-binding transcription regulator n=1 Tax=Terrihalobacillus insolitus TaxID=2950438 RepID=A0A9X3WN56_9BACI|nr:DeoR/GlpR family DNA-binding transcription regulator [Terrihalobacillus insolitus]MDC3412204.1 DeoR/GlpR family DNA-binding transcription regulator [Terrihalobacillus insolitus]MDC3423102.1 DeoR/GlpR family DNA-binding transcription regulator [Terrihalobacillus insolitus]
MLQIERREKIYSKINRDGKILIENLVKEFDVSAMTIRRDLDALELDGRIIRSHGGAVSIETLTSETPYYSKQSKFTKQKEAIAKQAVTLIPKNAQIILDSGTTTLEIAKLIKHREDLTIVTNDIKITTELLNSKSNIILTGGNLQSEIGACLGPHVENLLCQIKVDIVFLGAHAIDLETGISAPTLDKSHAKKLMIKAASTKWVVADKSKFNQRAFAHVCCFDQIDGIITDSRLSTNDRKTYEKVIDLTYA